MPDPTPERTGAEAVDAPQADTTLRRMAAMAEAALREAPPEVDGQWREVEILRGILTSLLERADEERSRRYADVSDENVARIVAQLPDDFRREVAQLERETADVACQGVHLAGRYHRLVSKFDRYIEPETEGLWDGGALVVAAWKSIGLDTVWDALNSVGDAVQGQVADPGVDAEAAMDGSG